MAADLEQLGSGIALAPEAAEPAGTPPQDGRDHRDAFHIVHRGRAAVKPSTCRKRWLEARLAFLAFQAFDHRGFFTADVCPGAAVYEYVEIVTRSGGVLAEEPCVISFRDSGKQGFRLADIFSANVDIGRPRAHGVAGHQCAFDQLVRIVADDLAVLAGSGLRFIGVDDQETGTTVLGLLWHEGPFQPGRKTRTAAAAQAACLHLVDDGIVSAPDERLRIVPIAALLGSLQVPRLKAVEIGKDPVPISEHQSPPPNMNSAATTRIARRAIVFTAPFSNFHASTTASKATMIVTIDRFMPIRPCNRGFRSSSRSVSSARLQARWCGGPAVACLPSDVHPLRAHRVRRRAVPG